MAIEHVYVDASVSKHAVTRQFVHKLGIEPRVLDDTSSLFEKVKAHEDPWRRGKQVLLLTRNKGGFLKSCPGTREYICCGYDILHIGSYCTMDCAYCILQVYFHPPIMQYFVNHEVLMDELQEAFQQPGIRRMGTGEFTDSLIWETWSDLSTELVGRFASQDHAVLEFKTKTTAIGRFKELRHNKKTIMAWSLNTPQVIAGLERGTASLKARMRAAAQCQAWGYPVAFHFDPLVIYPGCEDDYRNVLKELFQTVSADGVVWISLGTFRFMPALRPVIETRFPASTLVYGEFVPGLDGKMRYFKPLRTNLYRTLVECIRKLAPNVTPYLCMEDHQVWEQAFGFTPDDRGGLPAMLDECARQHCHLL